MTRGDMVERLLLNAVPWATDAAIRSVLEAAMREAMDITHECGTPEGTEAAILDAFWDAIRCASKGKGFP